ncbi:MAG: amidohydrolase family protein [Xanthobacteraceae bacterium]
MDKRSTRVIIDWHSHIYTPEEAANDLGTLDGKSGPKWGERGCPMVLENFLDAHYKNGIDISVVTNAAHYLRGKAAHEELPAVQRWSDYAAEVQAKHKGTLYSFATILPCGGPAFIREAERAIRELGLKGIFIHSSHKGHYPDDDEARPFWELVEALDVPVMIHPPHLGFGEERMKEYRLASSIGRPFDLCLALGRLIVRGILEDFPAVRIVASHGGGGICETISRMDYAYELKEEAFFLGSYAPMKIKHPPSHYLKKMYLDTVTYNPPAVKMVLDWMGPDRVVYGSDAPPLTSLKPRAISLIKELDIPEPWREAIFWRNAARLLELPVAADASA